MKNKKQAVTDESAEKHNLQRDTLKEKRLRPLTRKQQAFIKHLVTNPKDSATKAVQAVYNTSSDNSASQIAVENLRKPQIKIELEKYLSTAEYTMLQAMNKSLEYGMSNPTRDGASHMSNAIQASKDIQDRLKGKATQRIEQRSTSVSVNIDLSGVTEAGQGAEK